MSDDLRKSKRSFTTCETTTCEELVVATRVSSHKAGKRSAPVGISIVHSGKEVAAKIKNTIASEVSKPIAYTPDEALVLYVDGGFSRHSCKLVQK